jgi:hypothetical protein
VRFYTVLGDVVQLEKICGAKEPGRSFGHANDISFRLSFMAAQRMFDPVYVLLRNIFAMCLKAAAHMAGASSEMPFCGIGCGAERASSYWAFG